MQGRNSSELASGKDGCHAHMMLVTLVVRLGSVWMLEVVFQQQVPSQKPKDYLAVCHYYGRTKIAFGIILSPS
jgi:hypothetical protein